MGSRLFEYPELKIDVYKRQEQDKVKRLCNDMTELLEKKLTRYLNEQ